MPSHDERSWPYGLKHQARAVAAQLADQDRSHFLVGSMSLRHENELHLLEFDEDAATIHRKIYRHPHEIWAIAPSPARADLTFTVYNEVADGASEAVAALWQMENCSFDDRTNDLGLRKLLTLGKHDGGLHNVLWNPSGDMDRVASVDGTSLRLWSIKQLRGAEPAEVITIPATDKRGTPHVASACWNPHSTQQIGTANDCSLRGWDLRSSKQSFTIDNAHAVQVRDLDFNPNRPNIIVSGGDDCAVRFWDTRNPKEALKEIRHHTHWVWRVAFNRFHDQLVLTSSSDTHVKLESVVTISSAAMTTASADDDADEPPRTERCKDGLVASYDKHDESVYDIAWSNADPWIFASLSYDGRLLINLVPDEEKYKIIL